MEFNKFSTQAKIECVKHYISVGANADEWLLLTFNIKDVKQATQTQLLKAFDTLGYLMCWYEGGEYDYYFEVESKSGNPVIVGINKG